MLTLLIFMYLFYFKPKQAIVWRYRFSQLKGSSDDNISKVKLQFQNPNTDQVETQVRSDLFFFSK